MGSAASVRPALVTLWKKPNSSAQEDFVCSGVFVAPACVLTAGHALAVAPQLWITAFGFANSSPVIRSVRHESLDAALLFIESVPPDAGFLACDRRLQVDRLPKPLTLDGSFEGRLEAPQVVTVLNFSADDRHYLIEPKQPRGQSGSPICTADGAVWAIAVRHYEDANTQRGGVIAVHQFADWMDPLIAPLLPSFETSAESPAESSVESRSPSLPEPASSRPDDSSIDPDAAADATAPSPVPPKPTAAALASIGLDDPDAPLIVSVCIVSDAPGRLKDELEILRKRSVDDALIPLEVRQRVRKADLVGLFGEATLRPRLFERLAITSFSAYVHYATRDQAAALSLDERRRRWLTELLAQRLRKRSEQVAVVYHDGLDAAAIDDIVARAGVIASGDRLGPRPVPVIATGRDAEGRPLIDLARLVATAVARHLALPNDADATTLFEHLRTRIRFAMNVVTKQRHTRDVDPLP